MTFRKGGRTKQYEKWFINGEPLEVVSVYKYLGLLFSNTLSWSKAVHTLSLQAKKATNMLIQSSIKCGGFSVAVAFELFDKMIVPVATYGAEIWGAKQYKEIEAIQIYYSKKILGLPIQTSNNAVLGECGRMGLYHLCVKVY